MIEVQEFIKANKDWEVKLSNPPYCINISKDKMLGREMVMLKYNQINSDFNLNIVRECRGLILDANTFEIISYPFYKFGNYGEIYCPKIDWKSARISEKIDGSLIKIVRLGNEIIVSTNGTIDAFKAPIANQIGCKFKSFGDLVSFILTEKGITYNDFQENFTYMFELVSPWTRVVIPYKDNDLYFLGYRNNNTLTEYFPESEINLSAKFKMPKLFHADTFEACIEMAKNLPWDEEGYVVTDKNFNRVKVKSPAWLSIHHLSGNGVLSSSRTIKIILANEIEEVCAYFEEYRKPLNEIKAKFDSMIKTYSDKIEEFYKQGLKSRKEQAAYILENFGYLSGLGFSILDGKAESVKDWFYNLEINKLIKILGLKEEYDGKIKM